MEDKSQQSSSSNLPATPVAEPSAPNLATNPKHSRFKKPLIALAIIVALAGLGAGAWVMLKKDTKDSSPVSNAASTNQNGYISEGQTSDTEPSAIIFGQRKDDTSPYEIFWKPINGSDKATSALKLEKDDYFTQSQTAGQFVALSVEGKNGPVIWLSTDSGKTYQKVWSGQGGDDGQLGDQITSILFSRDQKRLVFAVLGKPDSTNGPGIDLNNTVKEINLTDGSIKDLFSPFLPGVFLKDYDSAKLVLFYSSGCYNCDGNIGLPVYRQDLIAGKNTIVPGTAGRDARYLLSIGFRSDTEDFLYLLGTSSSEGLGAAEPYEVVQYNSQTNLSSTVLEENLEYLSAVGYGDDNTPYYAKGSKVFSLDDKKMLFDAEKTILRVGYLSKQLIITESGDYPNQQVAAFNVAEKKATNLLSGNANTVFIGVVEQ